MRDIVKAVISKGMSSHNKMLRMAEKECKDHLGNTYSSEADMCKFYGIKYQTYWARIHKQGLSIKEALTGSLREYSVSDHLGNKFPNIPAMLKYHGIGKKPYLRKLALGCSLKDALDPNYTIPPQIGEGCVDHLGNAYPSIAEMCRSYGIQAGTYLRRIKDGWSQKDALTKSLCNKTSDHLGNEYKSSAAMCRDHGVSAAAFYSRKSAGLSIKECLNPESRIKAAKQNLVRQGGCYDHLGNWFPSKSKMCKAYDTSVTLLNRRIKAGQTLEEALSKGKRDTSVTDHLGVTYPNVNEMCSAHNIKPATYLRRIKLRWNKEQALTALTGSVRPHNGPHTEVVIGGQRFRSISEAARKYNMPWRTLAARIHAGVPEKQLTAPAYHCTEFQDHHGAAFGSMAEMAEYYGITEGLLKGRLYKGWTLAEALEIPRNLSLGEYRTAECLKRMNVRFYHDCTIKRIFTDLKIDVKWSAFLEKLQQNLESSGIKWSKQRIERLRPDFVLLNDDDGIRGVIEFDGTQHQRFTDHFFATVAEFLMRCDADTVKQSLWEYLSIPMLRIRNDQADRIDDMVSDFLARPEFYIQNHNPFLKENEYWAPLNSTLAELGMAMA